MEREDPYRRRYSFGPLERRGIAGGLRGGQVTLLGGGAIAAFLAFKVSEGGGGLLVGVLVAGLASAVALAPVRGRGADQWLAVLLGYIRRRYRGESAYRAAAPTAGTVSPLDGADSRRLADLPSTLNGCEVLTVPVAGGREVGVFRDGQLRGLTVVAAVRVRAFGLLSEAEQERRLERWGQALASLARSGSAIRRVQILERTVPADGDALQRYLAEARDSSLSPQAFARRSYEALLAGAGFVTQDHELFIALQVDEQRAAAGAGRLARARHTNALELACTAAVREMETFVSRFDPSDVVVDGVLSPRMLSRAIRLAYDPYGRERLNRLAVVDPAGAGVDPESFGPVAANETWDRYRTDSAVHRTYWVAQWPRLAVAPTFLAPLLLSAEVVRSLSVVLEPVPPERARRAVEAALTSDQADEEVRAQRGFRTTARQRKRAAAVERREHELAAGHQEFRYAAFVTVSGADDDGLEAACEQVEQAAHQAYLDLQPLWGEQPAAFTFGALPIARGLKAASALTGGTW